MRQEQARRTRAAILDAAGRLFIERGYGATTMKDIAAAAGVSVESVYAQGGKSALLLACVDRAIAGDDEEQPLLERESARVLLVAESPEQWLHGLRELAATGVPADVAIFEAFHGAAAIDAKLAEQWQIYSQRRYADCVRMIATLGPHLRPGLTREAATDVFWALVSPAVMLGLCVERGWTTEQYALWLADSVRRLLLT
ncbi:helix-turn-helix domain-containing protein [Actinoplanes sp. NPDC024001]|uniref:TetR/AcrR family transcriptional regulator n=1 Tax=Actinoplanes sp. NPDC024001 TaxID=3154598 RepID=UPI0033F519BF